MTDGHHGDEQQRLLGEANVTIFPPPLSEEQKRMQAEKDAENAYKQRQLTLGENSVALATSNRNLTRTLAIFTFLAAAASWYQGCISKRSADAAISAASTASKTLCETQRNNRAQDISNKNALQATIENFHKEQRAWISFQRATPAFYGPNNFPTIQIQYANTGRTPAVDARFGINRIPTEIPRSLSKSHKTEVDTQLTQYFKGITMESISPITPGIQQYELVPADPDDLRRKLNSIQKMESDLYVAGRIIYKDVGGNPQWADYCFDILYTDGRYDYRFCDIGNQMSYEK